MSHGINLAVSAIFLGAQAPLGIAHVKKNLMRKFQITMNLNLSYLILPTCLLA